MGGGRWLVAARICGKDEKFMEFREALNNGFIVFDGAMGTMIQRQGLKPGQPPETFNILHPEVIEEIHREYIQAGAHVVTTNTFGANELKLKGTGYSVEQVVGKAVELARRAAGDKWVALDMGPIGQLMEPMGTLTFDRAYELYATQVRAGAGGGADLILIETIGDLHEAKAAVLAAKENSSLPVICTLTFEQHGRTLIGTDPKTAVVVLEGLGVDALGVNCSLGPEELMPIVKQFISYASVPVLVQPNAGLPKIVDGQAVYPMEPDTFYHYASMMIKSGVRLLGGCCGTSPDFIKAIRKAVGRVTPVKIQVERQTAVASGSRTIVLGDGVGIIGGRLRAKNNENLRAALNNNNLGDVLSEAIEQRMAGADILAINVDIPNTDEKITLPNMVREIQGVVNLPLQLESCHAAALEAGARVYNGKPLIRWAGGSSDSMRSIFHIVKKYGACIVGLTVDDKSAATSCAHCLKIAKRIVHEAQDYGIPKEDIIIDCVIEDALAHPNKIMEKLEAIRRIKGELGVKTTMEIDRACAGLPKRGLIDRTFLAMALAYGVDAPVLDPLCSEMMETIHAFKVLAGQESRSRQSH